MIKVMIVDDSHVMRTILNKIIVESGFEVVCEAATGFEAIQLYAEYHPDIVTMDITMPDLDGVHAVTKIMQRFPNAKIIMCSAMGQKPLVIDAVLAGAKDFIVKPFEAERVKESVLKVLGLATPSAHSDK
ncbi:response regulator [Paenibacillus roseipurpureus]|uniref:Response regulator n=1 Tax=Paenibacillus roseopurpureus TaxID=2918901 RepID=A0AA96LL97_9BACL|nr:response regulator [Paenibacillus sp. MBLB1832]WNR42686.1 response regulator [Paenibacillus sp. MBLB1832]